MRKEYLVTPTGIIYKAKSKFFILKEHEGFESRNMTIFEGSLKKCKEELQNNLSLACRNGADVIKATQVYFICNDYGHDGEKVIFKICSK